MPTCRFTGSRDTNFAGLFDDPVDLSPGSNFEKTAGHLFQFLDGGIIFLNINISLPDTAFRRRLLT
jgi:hypothetical protein